VKHSSSTRIACRHEWILGCAIALATVACGGENDEDSTGGGVSAQLDGIYALSDITRNDAGCVAEGGSVLTEYSDTHFVICTVTSPFAYTTVAPCSDVAACHSLVDTIRSHSPFSADWITTLGYTDDAGLPRGHQVGTGFGTADGTCTERTIVDTNTSQPAAGTVRLESRTYALPDAPQDSEGFCVAESQEPTPDESACTSLEVITGTFVEAL